MANKTVTVEVAEGISSWSYGDDLSLEGGQYHEITVGTKHLDSALGAAVAAGVLNLIDGEVAGVESDEDSLAKQEVAVAARQEHYEARDEQLNAAVREVIDANNELPEKERLSTADLDAKIVETRRAKFEEWETEMETAAQKAVEGKN